MRREYNVLNLQQVSNNLDDTVLGSSYPVAEKMAKSSFFIVEDPKSDRR